MPLRAPPPLETPRLLLRLVTPADLPGLMQVNGDDAVTRFLPYATWTSAADGEAWLQRMANIQATGTALQFVVVERRSGLPIGTCLLFRYDEGSARAELGYVLGRAHWGSGCMHEALAALIDAAFGTLALRRLEAEVDPRNVASARLLQRLGFRREGLLRQRWVTKGEAKDVEAYGLLRDEWRRDGAPPQALFETERLLVRRVEPGDVDAMHAVYGDADAMRWVGDGRPLDRSRCVEWVAVTERNYAARGYGMAALVERASGAVIGFMGLVHPGGQAQAEIKYALKRSHWGKGLASEAAAGMLAYAARAHGIGEVIATAAPENLASHRVLLKAGMARGDLRRNDDGSLTQLFGWRPGGTAAAR